MALLRATCPTCADATHRFERDTMRGLLSAIRAILRLQSRRPKERPLTLPLVVDSQGEHRVVHVPLDEFPLYLPCPIFPPPGILTGAPPLPARCDEIEFRYVAGPSFEDVRARMAVDNVGARLIFTPQDFARTLAKIGYCTAVYKLGIDAVRDSPLRKVIRGDDINVGHYVGAWTSDAIDQPKGLHAMQVRAAGTEVHVALRLFAQFGAPAYHVVVGPAHPAFVASAAWPWK